MYLSFFFLLKFYYCKIYQNVYFQTLSERTLLYLLLFSYAAISSVVPGALPQPYMGDQDLPVGLSLTMARVIENPCFNPSTFFVGDPPQVIEVVVKETDFTSSILGTIVS